LTIRHPFTLIGAFAAGELDRYVMKTNSPLPVAVGVSLLFAAFVCGMFIGRIGAEAEARGSLASRTCFLCIEGLWAIHDPEYIEPPNWGMRDPKGQDRARMFDGNLEVGSKMLADYVRDSPVVSPRWYRNLLVRTQNYRKDRGRSYRRLPRGHQPLQAHAVDNAISEAIVLWDSAH